MNLYADQNQPRVENLAVTYPNRRISSIWEQIEKSNLMRRMSQLHCEVKKFSNQILRIFFLDRKKTNLEKHVNVTEVRGKKGEKGGKREGKGWDQHFRGTHCMPPYGGKGLWKTSLCVGKPLLLVNSVPTLLLKSPWYRWCNAGQVTEKKSALPKLYFRFGNLMLVRFPPFL